MKSPITIDFENSTITVNAAYAKKASNPFSEEYAQIQKVRADYPTFTVRTRSIKKNAAKDSYKGLTYAYMTLYIEKKAGERKEELMAEFNELRGCIDGKRNPLAEKASYGEVRAWFLEQFTEITEFNEKLAAKRAILREEREMKKLEALFA